MDFINYENSSISNFIQKIKKKSFKNNIKFIAISDWLKNKAQKSKVLEDKNIIRIYNNINLKDFKIIEKKLARSNLDIKTKKHVILYGAQNPQSTRKGWSIFLETIKKLDKKVFILIFGSFWSQQLLDDVGIEYKNLGFINDKTKLNMIYSSADFLSSLQYKIHLAKPGQKHWPVKHQLYVLKIQAHLNLLNINLTVMFVMDLTLKN